MRKTVSRRTGMPPTLTLAAIKFLLEEASRSRNSLRVEWTARKTRWLSLRFQLGHDVDSCLKKSGVGRGFHTRGLVLLAILCFCGMAS